MAPGGTLKVRLPAKCTVRISPLNPHTTNWDQAKVDMEVLGESDSDVITAEIAEKVASEMKADAVSDHEPGRNFLRLEAPEESTPTAFARNIHFLRAWIGGPFRGHRPLFDSRVVFDVRIPGRFDLDFEMTAGCVELKEVFEGDVRIQTGTADVIVDKLKSTYIDIESDGGDFSASVLQGNVSVRSSSGIVDIGRIQGPSVKLISEAGNIQTRALYADYAMLRTNQGTVRLGGAQGYTKVRTREGNVEVIGVEGRFDVETDSGDVETRLSVPQVVSMRSRTGDISVGLPETLCARLLVEGGSGTDIDSNVLPPECREKVGENIVIGEIRNKGGAVSGSEKVPSIHARAPSGDVIVRSQAWNDGVRLSPDDTRGQFPRWISGNL